MQELPVGRRQLKVRLISGQPSWRRDLRRGAACGEAEATA